MLKKPKTKCMIFSKRLININDVDHIILNGMPLPFVTNVKHIGNLLESDNSIKEDISIKRAQFI